MQRVYVIYVDGRPKYYSYIAKLVYDLAKNLVIENSKIRVFAKPALWIQSHQQVLLIEPNNLSSIGDEKADIQKLQVTRQKIFALFHLFVPVRVYYDDSGKNVEFGIGAQSINVVIPENAKPAVVTKLDKRLLRAITRRYTISHVEGHDAIIELALWISDQWEELNLRETPW